MAAPTRASWQKVKRIARFLLEFPRLVWRFGEEFLLEAEVVNQPSHELPVLVVHTDDDAHVVMNVGVGGDGGSNEGVGTHPRR